MNPTPSTDEMNWYTCPECGDIMYGGRHVLSAHIQRKHKPWTSTYKNAHKSTS